MGSEVWGANMRVCLIPRAEPAHALALLLLPISSVIRDRQQCPAMAPSAQQKLASAEQKLSSAHSVAERRYRWALELRNIASPPLPIPTRHVFAEQPEGVVSGSQAGPQEGDHVGVAQLRRIKGGKVQGAGMGLMHRNGHIGRRERECFTTA